MKNIVALLLLIASPAFADDAKPPSCGKTVAECQAVIDGLNLRLSLVKMQRANLRAQLDAMADDQAVEQEVHRQTAAGK